MRFASDKPAKLASFSMSTFLPVILAMSAWIGTFCQGKFPKAIATPFVRSSLPGTAATTTVNSDVNNATFLASSVLKSVYFCGVAKRNSCSGLPASSHGATSVFVPPISIASISLISYHK